MDETREETENSHKHFTGTDRQRYMSLLIEVETQKIYMYTMSCRPTCRYK